MKNIFIIMASIVLVACNSNKEVASSEATSNLAENVLVLTQEQLAQAKVKLGTLEMRSVATVIKVNGQIDVPPQNIFSVSMPMGGYLKSTKLLPGMHIKKGEVIATMEDQKYVELQQEYLTTKSKKEFAQAEFNRQQELNQQKASSDKVFQQAKMELETQSIALKALAEKLKIININPDNFSEKNISKSINLYSPFSGFVATVNVNSGKFVNPSDVLFELIDPSDIHLNLMVFEKDLDKLSVGQKVLAYNNSHPDKKYELEIILISRNISAERTVEVHCHFEQYDDTLLPGMYMNAEIENNLNMLPTLPTEAIINFEGHNHVFIANANNNFEMVNIQIGQAENGFTEIKNSENLLNKQVVVAGAYTLLMALKNTSEE